MLVGIGLGLTSLARGGRWSPGRLFAGGEQGFWFDAADLGSLFQDAAGTTPVTATGQPVGRWLDKSGRGNHATQSTALARPTLAQDGGGQYYVNFDAVDDAMSVPSAAFPTGDNARSQVFRWRPGGVDSSPLDYGAVATNGRRWFTPGRIDSGALRQHVVTYARTVNSGLAIPATQTHVSFVGLPQGGQLGDAVVRVNGVAGVLTGDTATAVDTAAGTGTLGNLSNAKNGSRIYGGLQINRLLTPAEIARLEAYFGVAA